MKVSTEGEAYYIDAYDDSPTIAHIGDTFYHVGRPVDPLLGFQPNKAMVRNMMRFLQET